MIEKKITYFEKVYRDVITFKDYDIKKKFDYSPLLIRSEFEDTFLFFAMKSLSRIKKDKETLLSYICKYDKILETISALAKLNLYEKDIFILMTSSTHCNTVCVRFSQNRNLKIFFYDCYDNSVADVLFETFKKYVYPVKFYSCIGNQVQYSMKGCFWFSLEAIFRLSYKNIFMIMSDMEKKNQFSKKLNCLSTENKEIKCFNTTNIPPEIASIFTSCQSNSSTYTKLPEHIKTAVVSSKIDPITGQGLTLSQSIARRNLAGFNYFQNHPAFQGLTPPMQWPNTETLKESPEYQNWSIVYFKIRQLEKMISWLKTPAGRALAIETLSTYQNIESWNRTMSPENLSRFMG